MRTEVSDRVLLLLNSPIGKLAKALASGHLNEGAIDITSGAPIMVKDMKATVDCVVTSPPYKKRDGYTDELMGNLGYLVEHMLKPGGRVFLNFGQLRESMSRPFTAARVFANGSGLEWGQTIAWVKSIAIDDRQIGHYQPLNSDKVLNYCWEPIFTFYKKPELPLDRLAIGVPFADKSNLKRGTRGQHGDLHCGGDAWHIPYKTTGAKNKKRHRYEYPEELVERCLRVANLPEDATVLDPFCGSGTTLCVAKRLGYHGIGIDKIHDTLKSAEARWEAT